MPHGGRQGEGQAVQSFNFDAFSVYSESEVILAREESSPQVYSAVLSLACTWAHGWLPLPLVS